MSSQEIPDIVIGRLPIYLRALSRMMVEGKEIASSYQLAERLGISSAQIRKDLSYFGEFGKPGTGYPVRFLQEQLQRILKLDHEWQVALVGAGELGRALAHYNGFRDRGFHIAAAYDNDPAKIGQMLCGLKVQSASELVEDVRARALKMAILAVPADQAQEVTDRLVKAGIHAILSYAPIHLTVPDSVSVQCIDPVVHLQRMAYYIKPPTQKACEMLSPRAPANPRPGGGCRGQWRMSSQETVIWHWFARASEVSSFEETH